MINKFYGNLNDNRKEINMKQNGANLGTLIMIVLVAILGIFRATTRTNRLMNSCRRLGRPGLRPTLMLAVLITLIITVPAAMAKPASNLDQCANGGVGDPPLQCIDTAYINGNLNENQAHYLEGESVPYRAIITDLTPGETYTLTIEWDTTVSSGKHALDYITSFDRTETDADSCTGVVGVDCAITNTAVIPGDSQVSDGPDGISGTADDITQEAGVFTIYGGTITGVSSYTYTGDFSSASTSSIIVTFTYDGGTVNGGTTVLAWGGHIATRQDWGFGNSAVSISGSPFHMRLTDFTCTNPDNCGVGQQDRSLSSGAVIFPGSIIIVKDAAPEGDTTFDFTASPSPLVNFNLVDDGTTANTQQFSDIIDFTTYTVMESPIPTGWDLTDISCIVLDPNGGTQSPNVGTATVTIGLEEGEYVECTFYDEIIPDPSLSLLKEISDSASGPWSPSITVAGGSPVYYQFTITNTGNVELSPVSLSDPTVDTASCTLPESLEVGETGIATCVVGAVTAETLAGNYINTATASGTYDGDTYTDTDSASYTVEDAPALTLDKRFVDYIDADGSSDISVGDTLNYAFDVSNTGNVELTNVIVSDPMIATITCPSGNPIPSLAVSASETCTGSYMVQSSDLGTTIHNTGTADSDQTDPVEDTEDVPVPSPSMTIDKTSTLLNDADSSGDVSAGDTIEYTYTVVNTGATNLTGVTVEDDLLGTVTLSDVAGDGVGYIALGGSDTGTLTYVILPSMLERRSLTSVLQTVTKRDRKPTQKLCQYCHRQ